MSLDGNMSCLQDRFEAQVLRTPDNIAVECEGVRLTYRQLSERSSRVVELLRPVLIEPGQLVGLFLRRSVDLIVGLLGILKAGGAYVPIDPSYPADRIRLLLADSGVKTVVTGKLESERLGGVASVVLVDLAEPRKQSLGESVRVASSDAAYVIYTSGSTGTPKGTVVEHRNVTSLFDAAASHFDFGPSDVWTMFHSISFDFSVWEIWGALLFGGRLVIVPSAVAAAPVAFAALVEESKVTVLNQTPTAFAQFSRASLAAGRVYPSLATVIFGGERLDAAHIRAWVEHHGVDRPRLVNMYGITETTVHVSYRPITTEDLLHSERSAIGQPLPHLEVHLLDEFGNEPAPLAPGEIVVAGSGVSRGYLNRPELTAERFPMLPLGPDGELVRCYRSGDLAFRADGELFYVKRSDDQVKVRGFRIELREVEIQLEQCPGVEGCTVIAKNFGDGDVRLIAFVVPQPGSVGVASSVAALAARTFPAYMCPSRVVELSQLPLTAHGKVDRAELDRRFESALPGALSVGGAGHAVSKSGTTGRIAELARTILQPDVLPDRDLFEQGATSLTLARLILDVNAAFGLSLNGSELEGDSSIVNIGAIVDQMIERSAERTAAVRMEDTR